MGVIISRKEHPLVGLAGPPPENLRQERLSGSGIADENQVGPFLQKIKIEQAQDLWFVVQT